jgi:hypothetical protein
MTEIEAATAVYDVRGLSAKLAKLTRVGRGTSWAGLAIGLFVLADSAWRALQGPLGGILAVWVAGLGFGLFMVGISTWAILHWRPGADSVTVDGEGVHLHYRKDRKVILRWTDPHLSFDLEDGSVLPSEVTKGGLLYVLKARTGDTPLTKEAFFDVLACAQQHNLVTRSGRDRVLLMPPSMWLMDYHIRGSHYRAKEHTGSL